MENQQEQPEHYAAPAGAAPSGQGQNMGGQPDMAAQMPPGIPPEYTNYANYYGVPQAMAHYPHQGMAYHGAPTHGMYPPVPPMQPVPPIQSMPHWHPLYAQQMMAAGYAPANAPQPPFTNEFAAGFAQGQSTGHAGGHAGPTMSTTANASSQNEGLKAMLNEIGQATGLGKLSELLSLDDREFWKGAMIGASIAMLASNKNLHSLIMGMAGNMMASMNGGANPGEQPSAEPEQSPDAESESEINV